VKIQSPINDRNESRRLVLCVPDFEFTCFFVPVKQLKPSPVRVVEASRHVTGRKIEIDHEYPNNLDFSHGRFSFDF